MKIDFQVDTEYGVFKDALNLTDDEFSSLTEFDIEQMKKQRVDNWIKIITSASPDVE